MEINFCKKNSRLLSIGFLNPTDKHNVFHKKILYLCEKCNFIGVYENTTGVSSFKNVLTDVCVINARGFRKPFNESC